MNVSTSQTEYTLLQEILDKMPGYVYRLTQKPVPKLMFLSKGINQITGYQAEVYLHAQRNISQDIHPEDRDRVWLTLKQAFLDKQPFECEYRLMHLSGTYLWVWERAKPIFDEQDELLYIEGFVTEVTARKKLKDELKTQVYTSQHVLQHLLNGIIVVDMQSRIRYANDSAKTILDLDMQENEETNIFFLQEWQHIDTNGRHLPAEANILQKVLQEKATLQGFEQGIIMSNGQIKWLLINASPFLDEKKQKVIGAAISFSDISAQKNAQNQIEVSEMKLTAIADSTTEIIILISPNFEILYANKAAKETYKLINNRPLKEGDIIWEHINQTHIADFAMYFAHALTGRTTTAEQVLNIQNEKRWLRTNYFPVYNKNHQFIGVSFNAIDITLEKEQDIIIKQTNEELLASEEELRQNIEELTLTQEQIKQQNVQLTNLMNALENSTILSITDRKGRIIKANATFCNISQYTLNELLGNDHRIINSGYHPKAFWQEMWETITKGKVWQGEVKNKAKDGSYYWVHSVNNPIFDTEGNITHFFSVRFLITDRKEAEQKIKEQNDALTEIAFFQSHILRRPIANILGLIQLIELEKEQQPIENTHLLQYLELLQKATQEADEIITNIVQKTNDFDTNLL